MTAPKSLNESGVRMVSGDYKIIINIEDDSVTCNSHTVFSQLGRNAEHHNFFYVDRHGNWVVGRYYRSHSNNTLL